MAGTKLNGQLSDSNISDRYGLGSRSNSIRDIRNSVAVRNKAHPRVPIHTRRTNVATILLLRTLFFDAKLVIGQCDFTNAILQVQHKNPENGIIVHSIGVTFSPIVHPGLSGHLGHLSHTTSFLATFGIFVDPCKTMKRPSDLECLFQWLQVSLGYSEVIQRASELHRVTMKSLGRTR